MKKFIDAIKEKGFTKIAWLFIALACLVFGEVLVNTIEGLVPSVIVRIGWFALGVFCYVNFNIFYKYYTDFRGVVGWPVEERANLNQTKYNR